VVTGRPCSRGEDQFVLVLAFLALDVEAEIARLFDRRSRRTHADNRAGVSEHPRGCA
jgi:hypothetical protein